nr:hypothetical protein [Algoriphagus sp.]|tara:strand:- start:164 stop:346 length:183 start_codon:yes stop_codon:yes gene_type:complete
MQTNAQNKTITMFFGERNFDTLNDFDLLKRRLRRSRTGTLDFLINYYKTTERKRIQPIIL